MKINFFNFKLMSDERGKLVAVEENQDIPFDIKRVYYIYDVKDARGFHAHKKLKQAFICLNGSCKILLDNGKEKQTVELNRPDKALYIEPGVWREMSDFSKDAILLVLASDHYDENDYIRDYQEFLRYVR